MDITVSKIILEKDDKIINISIDGNNESFYKEIIKFINSPVVESQLRCVLLNASVAGDFSRINLNSNNETSEWFSLYMDGFIDGREFCATSKNGVKLGGFNGERVENTYKKYDSCELIFKYQSRIDIGFEP